METVDSSIYKAEDEEEEEEAIDLLTGRLEALSKYIASMAQAQPSVA